LFDEAAHARLRGEQAALAQGSDQAWAARGAVTLLKGALKMS